MGFWLDTQLDGGLAMRHSHNMDLVENLAQCFYNTELVLNYLVLLLFVHFD